jgi:transcriptional regulator with XRE-family HTH domain
MKSHIIYPLLASRRRMLGMSQQELAARAGLRREKVNRLESKYEDVGLDELCRLLDAVGLELSISKKGASSAKASVRQRQQLSVPASNQSHHLKPRDFEKAAFIDGAKARILDWGKVPR